MMRWCCSSIGGTGAERRTAESTLIVVGHEHRLADPESLKAMVVAVEEAETQAKIDERKQERDCKLPGLLPLRHFVENMTWA